MTFKDNPFFCKRYLKLSESRDGCNRHFFIVAPDIAYFVLLGLGEWLGARAKRFDQQARSISWRII
jgi:hypothetical protein